jgi:hypothetical protein
MIREYRLTDDQLKEVDAVYDMIRKPGRAYSVELYYPRVFEAWRKIAEEMGFVFGTQDQSMEDRHVFTARVNTFSEQLKDLFWEIRRSLTGDINWYRANNVGLFKLTKEKRRENLERLRLIDPEAYCREVEYDYRRGWR